MNGGEGKTVARREHESVEARGLDSSSCLDDVTPYVLCSGGLYYVTKLF